MEAPLEAGRILGEGVFVETTIRDTSWRGCWRVVTSLHRKQKSEGETKAQNSSSSDQ